MDKLITIKTFTYPYELAVIRSRLESEGIETFVQDEHTTQVNTLFSGGIKLQVRQEDLKRSISILNEVGILEIKSEPQNSFFQKFILFKNRFRLLNVLRPEYVFITAAVLIIGFIVFFINYLTKPSKYEIISSEMWCVERIFYNQISYQPKTEMFVKLVGPNFCEEGIHFSKNDVILLPGFNSKGVTGGWKIKGDSLKIFSCDTFGFIYNGNYFINFDAGKLVLNSNHTSIECYKIIFRMPH